MLIPSPSSERTKGRVVLVAAAALVALLLSSAQLSPAGSEELTASERRQLDQGALVVKTRTVEDYP